MVHLLEEEIFQGALTGLVYKAQFSMNNIFYLLTGMVIFII